MKLIKYIFLLAIIVIAIVLGYRYLPLNTTEPTPTSTPEGLKVTFLDVGQADCTVIQSGEKFMLIDAGSNSGAINLVSRLSGMGIRKLDVVVGTHPHEDHIGGMDAVINQFDIGQIYLPKVTATTKTFTDLLEAIKSKNLSVNTPVPGTTSALGMAQWTILAPNNQSYSETNDYSIVIRLFYGKAAFMFTGDAEANSEKEILAKGFNVESDVLKLGHHGSTSSSSQEFLQAVGPKYGVIFVGKDNDYGHPHQEILERLKAGGVTVFRTDLNGTITFTSDGSNLTVKTEE